LPDYVIYEQAVIKKLPATQPSFNPGTPTQAAGGAAGVAAPSSLALLVLPLADRGEELVPPTVPSEGSTSVVAATVEVLRLESVLSVADLKEAVVRGGTDESPNAVGDEEEEPLATAVAGGDDVDDGGATASRLCSETSSTTRPRMNPSRSVLLPELVPNLSFYEFYNILQCTEPRS
jgi:hypothetical protein